jgi:hypothetical protein
MKNQMKLVTFGRFRRRASIPTILSNADRLF